MGWNAYLRSVSWYKIGGVATFGFKDRKPGILGPKWIKGEG